MAGNAGKTSDQNAGGKAKKATPKPAGEAGLKQPSAASGAAYLRRLTGPTQTPPSSPAPHHPLLACLVWPSGAEFAGPLETDAEQPSPRREIRLFFADPTSAEAVSLDQPEQGTPEAAGVMRITELREISSGLMVSGYDLEPLEAPVRLKMVATSAPQQTGPETDTPPREAICAFQPTLPEVDLFAGRNTLFAQRLEEPAETVLEWLAFHAEHHKAEAALILNRAPDADDRAQFFKDLQAGIAEWGLPMQVVVLDPETPLGKRDLGPENHPFLAPDAPGKDRMTPPAPDAWRSPLGRGIIFELVKWQFLARARAVLTLDVSDLLTPPQILTALRAAPDIDEGESFPEAATPTNAFDLCRSAASGVVLMVGRRVYPWRVRKDQRESFGDHICRQFDARRGFARWGCAPDIAGLMNTWRPVRVAYAKPDIGVVVPFLRAMAVRVSGRAASELAPKTSLVEDPALLQISTEIFGFKPIRPPVSKLKAAPKQAAQAGRTCIVTTMKNEGPFILEWLAYHRAIGVEDFLVYTNDCTDGTDMMLDMLQAKGLLQHRANPWVPGGELKPQHAALQASESEPIMQNAGWAICMDVDEFIDIKIGDGTLNALYTAMGEANMISLTWRLFGNCDVHEYKDEFLLKQFTTCAPEIVRKPHQAWGFKTLFRNIDIYKKIGVHRPKGLVPDLWDKVKWLNGSGKPMPREMFRNGWRSTLETYGYDWVQLNHYAVRSAESFLVKRDRGRVNHVDRDQGLNYWFRMNHNPVVETSIQRMIPALQAEFDRLMADPEIRAAHEHSVKCHVDKIKELRATENYEKFYGELCSERFEKLSRMLHVFGSNVFGAGPNVLPEDIHTRDLPPDFFFTVEHQGEAEH